jgi:hypothetical protein
MSFEQTVNDAVERAFQSQVMPLLQAVLEQKKFVNLDAIKEEIEELWDTKQVAAYLKMSPITIEMWRYDGRGPSFSRINGNRVRYKKSVVLEFAERNKSVLGRKGRPPHALVEQVKEEVKQSGLIAGAGRARKVAVAHKGGK